MPRLRWSDGCIMGVVDAEATMRTLHSPAGYRDLTSSPGTTDPVLRALADCPYPFVWEALAANPRNADGCTCSAVCAA
jgi:hypothetical protein